MSKWKWWQVLILVWVVIVAGGSILLYLTGKHPMQEARLSTQSRG